VATTFAEARSAVCSTGGLINKFPGVAREFITLLGGAAAAWPVAARAQQPERMRRIGVLVSMVESDSRGLEYITAFAQGLAELGWAVGRNVRIEYRWGAGDLDRFRRYAAELVALAPDVVLASSGSIVGAFQQASPTVPIVFVGTIDPVGGGYVESLSRPGTNATGFASFEFSMSGKWLELLKEIAPDVKRVAVIRDPAVPAGSGGFAAIQTVAPSFGVELTPVGVRSADEIEHGIAAFARSANGGLIVVGPSSSVELHRDLIITLAARPAACSLRQHGVEQGRRPDLLRSRSARPVWARRRLRRSHPQGRETRRPPRASADQVRTRHQSQGC
jgi:putative ABC transport system substrate-binding protein